MQRGDIKRAVELAVKTWPNKSQQEIAEQVGCNVSTACRAKDNLPTQFIPPTRTDSLGRTRPPSHRRFPDDPGGCFRGTDSHSRRRR